MMQRFYWTFIHGEERGHDHAERDDGEQDGVLDDANDEVMLPEGVHPVGFLSGASHGEAVSEADVHGELEPDDLSDDSGNERQ